MRNYTKKALAAITMVAFVTAVSAIDKDMTAGKTGQDPKDLESLKKTEDELDKQIKFWATELQKKHALAKIGPKVVQSPTQTIFNTDKDGKYIELVAYTFNPQSYNYGKPVGTAAKTMRLYFSGEKLTKIETIVDDQNFYEQYKYYTKAGHDNPVDGTPNAIKLETSFNKTTVDADKKADYAVTLGDIENDLTNPNRIKFKRDFYIEHLIYFEKLFRFTYEFQKRGASNGDVETIHRMKNSLRY